MPESSLRPSKFPAVAPPQGAQPPTFTPDNDVHLLDRIAILHRYRHISIAVFILASAAMMIQGYTSLQLYQGQAQIMIEDERATAVPGLNGPDTVYYEDPEPYPQHAMPGF